MIKLLINKMDINENVDQWALYLDIDSGYIRCILLGTGRAIKVTYRSVVGIELDETFSIKFDVKGYTSSEGFPHKKYNARDRIRVLEEAVRLLIGAQERGS